MNTKSIKEFFRPTKVKVVLLIFLMVYIFVEILWYFSFTKTSAILFLAGFFFCYIFAILGDFLYFATSIVSFLEIFNLAIMFIIFLICYSSVCFITYLYNRIEKSNKLLKLIFVSAIILFLFIPIGIYIPTSSPPNNQPIIMERAQQKINIMTLFVNDTGLYFEVMASGMNTMPINMEGTSFYIEGIPKTAKSWTGFSPNCTSGNLAPAESCYGVIHDYNLSNCHIGDVFKVTISWGAESFKKISGCTNP